MQCDNVGLPNNSKFALPMFFFIDFFDIYYDYLEIPHVLDFDVAKDMRKYIILICLQFIYIGHM